VGRTALLNILHTPSEERDAVATGSISSLQNSKERLVASAFGSRPQAARGVARKSVQDCSKQAPLIRHAFELVRSPLFESQARASDQVAYGL
jgi:hypothetical protein